MQSRSVRAFTGLMIAALVSGSAIWGASVAHATPPLSTPWPCDVSYPVTQGHNTGSHDGNGAWAWDIGIPEGQEVAAPADGVVRLIKKDSTQGGCSSTFGNSANYVVLDFGDGTEALMMHLAPNSSQLEVGDLVKQGDIVGRVGLTGWVCGAHLHFQIQETCASWWCQSIPAAFVDYGDPTDGTSLISNNCPMAIPCAPVGDGVTVIDELSTCFVRETSYWWNVSEGDAGHHYYTFGTDAAANDTIGHYRFDVSVDGTYAVEAFIPDSADTKNAKYTWSNGGAATELAVVDQSAKKGWVALGEIDLTAGAAREVVLGDATGEAYALRRHVAFDALRLTRIVESGTGGGGANGTGGGASGGEAGSGASGGDGGGEGGGEGADESGGCACGTSDARSAPSSWVFVAMVVWAVRRRMRAEEKRHA